MVKKFAISETIEAKEIKQIRNKLNLTQQEFALLVNSSKRAIENWETKKEPIKGPIVTIVKMLQLDSSLCEQLMVPELNYPLRLIYMHYSEICTIIDVDERNRKVVFYNYKKDNMFRAFGCKEKVSYEEYEAFLESRCFPKERDKMKIILRELDLPFYDPLLIIEKTKGRMAEDNFSIIIERRK